MGNMKKMRHHSKRKLPARSDRLKSAAKKPKLDSCTTKIDCLIKITDVNFDCLEKIFEYLNLTDLNNIAEAHVYFVAPARLVYKRQHGGKVVKIFDSSHMISLYDATETIDNIVDATATSFLQNFGELVQKLRLDYSLGIIRNYGQHHWRQTERAIFEHCTKTLTEIQLINCSGHVMEEIRKPFKKVTRVYIYHINTELTIVKLSKWFPNARQLELNCGASAVPTYANGEFPFLGEFQLVILNNVQNYRKNESKLRQFLRENRQITKLSIDSKFVTWLRCDFDFMLFINQTLQQLEKLRWIHMKMNGVGKLKRIHFERMKSFEFQTVGPFPNNVIISFQQLRSLKLYGISAIDRKWVDFIVQNKSLVKLGYFPNMRFHQQTHSDLLDITTKLPNLTALYLQAHTISPKYLERFLNQCHSSGALMKLMLKFFAGFKNDLNGYLDVVNQRHFNVEFKSNGTGDNVILHRIHNEHPK